MFAIDVQHDIATATAALHDSAVGRVEIICLTPSVQPNVSLNADHLERYANRRIDIPEIAGDKLQSSLIAALENLRAEPGDYDLDLRFGVKLYSRSGGTPLAAIYLDRWGKLGAINGVSVELSSDILKWAKRNLPICF